MARRCASFALLVLGGVAAGCTAKPPQTISVSKSVGTIVQTTGVAVACGGALAPDPTALFNGMQAANKLYPIAGFQLFKAPMCTQARLDTYRALVRFELTPIANLKGLVQSAELVVATRALPAGVGMTATFPGTINVMCPANLGGAGQLQRFPPSAQGTTSAWVSNAGMLTVLGPTDVFPTATTIYTFPATVPPPGPLAGASIPTTVSITGAGGSIFTSDVSGTVTAALNLGATEINYMITSSFEGPVPGPLPTGGGLDCKTSYDVQLNVTHH